MGASNMIKTAGLIAVLSCVSALPAAQERKDLPELFSFSQPTHNVAVYRGADLKNAIAAGLVKGFGSAGVVAAPAVAPVVKVAPRPVVIPAPAPVVRVAPVVRPAVKIVKTAPVVVKPAPVVVRPAPVVKAAPVVTSYAPAPVAYKPAPKVAYKPYVDPYADEDDYSAADFGAAESRDNYLTTGKYVVALPDGRVQTVSYTVDGGNGYVADVQYSGVAQYPDAPAGYSA